MWSLPIQSILPKTHQCLFTLSPWMPCQWWIYSLFPPCLSLLSRGEGWGCRGMSFHKDQPQRVACPTSQGPVSGVIDDVFITRCGSRRGASCLNGQPKPWDWLSCLFFDTNFYKKHQVILPNVSHTRINMYSPSQTKTPQRPKKLQQLKVNNQLIARNKVK